ncbi:MAG: hypothetical protein U5K54_28465 [Cytophagales bacterium]|nr:hypothetical protein [Cytophagales bacterium]
MLAATGLYSNVGTCHFYGGMINTKNIISTMMQSFIAMGVISVLWIVIGFSLAFGDIPRWVDIETHCLFFMFQNVLDGKPCRCA